MSETLLRILVNIFFFSRSFPHVVPQNMFAFAAIIFVFAGAFKVIDAAVHGPLGVEHMTLFFLLARASPRCHANVVRSHS